MHSRPALILVALLAAPAIPALIRPATADIIDCTVRDLQDTTSVMWDTLVTSGTTPDTLRIAGVITAGDTKPSGFGFYIEDFTLAPAYRGLDIFTGAHNSYADSGLVRGQLVRCTGRPHEFNGATQLISMSGVVFGDSLRIEHDLGIPGIPGPTTVSSGDISERSVMGEVYEGMFVKLNHQIRCTNVTNLPVNTWQGVDNSLVSPTDTILVDMATLANPTVSNPPVGNVATFLQGILDQLKLPPSTLRGYRLQIRDGADIIVTTPVATISRTLGWVKARYR